MTVTFSDPFLPPAGVSVKDAKAELRDKVYDFMAEHAGAAENVEYYHYVKKIIKLLKK